MQRHKTKKSDAVMYTQRIVTWQGVLAFWSTVKGVENKAREVKRTGITYKKFSLHTTGSEGPSKISQKK